MKFRFSIFKIVILITCLNCEKDATVITVTDIDGNIYQTITIGSQTWMKENLRTTHYANGIEIPNITEGDIFKWYTEGARCYYRNNELLDTLFGSMYNWYAVVDTCHLCPDGWHVPSDEEWQILVDYLGGTEVAGGKLKTADTIYWHSPNVGATNESGFSVLPGGYRDQNGGFSSKGLRGSFWATTIYNNTCARVRITEVNTTKARSDFATFEHAYYVRCVKDKKTE